jgi:hypothetical protein
MTPVELVDRLIQAGFTPTVVDQAGEHKWSKETTVKVSYGPICPENINPLVAAPLVIGHVSGDRFYVSAKAAGYTKSQAIADPTSWDDIVEKAMTLLYGKVIKV